MEIDGGGVVMGNGSERASMSQVAVSALSTFAQRGCERALGVAAGADDSSPSGGDAGRAEAHTTRGIRFEAMLDKRLARESGKLVDESDRRRGRRLEVVDFRKLRKDRGALREDDVVEKLVNMDGGQILLQMPLAPRETAGVKLAKAMPDYIIVDGRGGDEFVQLFVVDAKAPRGAGRVDARPSDQVTAAYATQLALYCEILQTLVDKEVNPKRKGARMKVSRYGGVWLPGTGVTLTGTTADGHTWVLEDGPILCDLSAVNAGLTRFLERARSALQIEVKDRQRCYARGCRCCLVEMNDKLLTSAEENGGIMAQAPVEALPHVPAPTRHAAAAMLEAMDPPRQATLEELGNVLRDENVDPMKRLLAAEVLSGEKQIMDPREPSVPMKAALAPMEAAEARCTAAVRPGRGEYTIPMQEDELIVIAYERDLRLFQGELAFAWGVSVFDPDGSEVFSKCGVLGVGVGSLREIYRVNDDFVKALYDTVQACAERGKKTTVVTWDPREWDDAEAYLKRVVGRNDDLSKQAAELLVVFAGSKVLHRDEPIPNERNRLDEVPTPDDCNPGKYSSHPNYTNWARPAFAKSEGIVKEDERLRADDERRALIKRDNSDKPVKSPAGEYKLTEYGRLFARWLFWQGVKGNRLTSMMTVEQWPCGLLAEVRWLLEEQRPARHRSSGPTAVGAVKTFVLDHFAMNMWLVEGSELAQLCFFFGLAAPDIDLDRIPELWWEEGEGGDADSIKGLIQARALCCKRVLDKARLTVIEVDEPMDVNMKLPCVFVRPEAEVLPAPEQEQADSTDPLLRSLEIVYKMEVARACVNLHERRVRMPMPHQLARDHCVRLELADCDGWELDRREAVFKVAPGCRGVLESDHPITNPRILTTAEIGGLRSGLRWADDQRVLPRGACLGFGLDFHGSACVRGVRNIGDDEFVILRFNFEDITCTSKFYDRYPRLGTEFNLWTRHTDILLGRVLAEIQRLGGHRDGKELIFMKLLSSPCRALFEESLARERSAFNVNEHLASHPLGLDTSQSAAVRRVIEFKRVAMWGPPGTGKTRALGAAVAAALLDGVEHILVTAPTNKAVALAMEAVQHAVCAVGFHDQAVRLGIVSSNDEGDIADEDQNQVKLETFGKKRLCTGSFWQQDCKIVIGSTVWKLPAADDKKFSELPPLDLVVVDEASQMGLAEAALALSLLKSETGRLLVVGDHMQLGPVRQCRHPPPPKANDPDMSGSLMDLLLRDHEGKVRLRDGDKRIVPDFIVKLSDNHRMNNELGGLHQATYGKDYKPVGDERLGIGGVGLRKPHDVPLGEVFDPQWKSLVVLRLPVYDEPRMPREAAETEAKVVCKLLKAFQEVVGEDWVNQVHVITPHHTQRKAVRTRVVSEGLCALGSDRGAAGEGDTKPPPPLGDLFVNTVEKAQGQSQSVVIVCLGVQDPWSARKEAQFMLQPNRLNVALTRAKHKLIVITSTALIEPDITCLVDSATRRGSLMLREICDKAMNIHVNDVGDQCPPPSGEDTAPRGRKRRRLSSE